MTTKTAKLSFQDAMEEAENELDSAESDPSSADDGSQQPEVSEGEQLAVENDDEVGLFNDPNITNQTDEQPDVDVDSLTVDVNGQNISVADLRKGYMMQADYTQKTQQLAEEKNEAEKAITLWKALQENPAETARQLYMRVNAGQGPVADQPAQESNVNLDELVEQKLQEKLANDPRLQAIEANSALAQVNTVFDLIESDNDVTLIETDRKLILERAVQLGTSDLTFVFAGMMHEKAAQDAEQNNAKAVSTSSGRRSDPNDAEESEESIKTIREAWEQAEKEQGVLSTVSNL